MKYHISRCSLIWYICIGIIAINIIVLWYRFTDNKVGKLVFESNSVELHDIPVGLKTASVSFVYSNPSDKIITISRIGKSCGCTTVSISKVILPYSTGYLNMVLPINYSRRTTTQSSYIFTPVQNRG